MMRFLAFLLLAAAWAITPAGFVAQAEAREEILTYETLIDVEIDGDFIVTERITVRAEGFEIRRGIFRDFPTVRRLPSGLVDRTTFEVMSVTRDGVDEPHHEEPIEGGTRLFIGSADVWIPPAVYTYEIIYRSRHQMGFFEDFDEVYWNATGNFWSFPIERAVATIQLPPGADIINTASFTGRFGSTKNNARASIVGPTTVRFETTSTLAAREGLTVAVSFQKGLIEEPSSGALQFKAVRDNAGIAAILIGAVLVFVYMLTSWMKVGRDPQRGVVFPRFEPPRGLSPAALSWVYYRGHKGGNAGKSFMAALVSLGTRGKLSIDEQDNTVTVRRTDEPGSPSDGELPPGERALMRGLLGSNDALTFNRSNARRLMGATSSFRASISQEFGGKYFKHNPGYTILGVVIAVISLFLFLVLFPGTEVLVVGVIFHFLGGAIVGLTLTKAYARFTGRAPQIHGFAAFAFSVTALGVIAILMFVFHTSPASEFASGWALQLTMLVAFAMGATIATFAILMFAPTLEGQKLMEEIEGFRLYLSVAEAERMNMVDAPDFSLELFERFLPYAIALGVEKPWSEALESHLAKMAPADRPSYRPGYYRGSTFNPGSIAASTTAIASTIGAAYASSMPKSSGSSGGGGGSSGGGGGGGGGGGW
ncbi:MAG: DUF2207 domain-containing protein [Rhizobiales bacterium]|nr:DUF2207 domain-containing protein [Hyphomicrobiales bacterium]MBO6700434.1 DUF2207 domain-containing protein [Hyphomicrobiales bacterium]MBO6737970.1 DUF2207 domain-containing protein [Hyphomicrobiales bacterium]MBO6913723.1 DUF2207 domain-containing protein [Hyphomicrobiales bacterium]MBO6954382.1 DUF2207 domain-containing protein [Hyphomicrobiales bacterium]